MTVRPIASEDFWTAVLPLLAGIFAEESPFSPCPFVDEVPVKKILFNWCYKYSLAPPLLQHLMRAAEAVGDAGFYLRGHLGNVSGAADDSNADPPAAWYVPFTHIDRYTNRQAPLRAATSFEQTLLSPSGQWGIITSHETHMLLGCNLAFWQQFAPLVPDINQQIMEFLRHWKDASKDGFVCVDDWLLGLMNQVYGAAIARQLLIDAGLI